MEIFDFITANKFWILLGFTALEKIVKISPAKWDDVLFDMIVEPIRVAIKKTVTGSSKAPITKTQKK